MELNSHFTSPELFTSNKSEILNIIILQRRDELINTFELYRERFLTGYDTLKLQSKIKAKLEGLYLELSQALERKYNSSKPKEKESDYLISKRKNYVVFKEHMDNLNELDDEQIYYCFRFINTALDELNLIKIDVKTKYDTTNIEEENEAKGL